MKHHFSESLVEHDGCPDCQQSAGVGEYHEGLECSTLPSVVVLMAKRNGGAGLSINFSAEQDGLDIGRLAHVSVPCPKYDLVSVVVYESPQSGGLVGHFVTLARDSSTRPWHVYDDTTVRIAQVKDLEGEGAYMFVYLQQGHDDTTPGACSDDGHHSDLETATTMTRITGTRQQAQMQTLQVVMQARQEAACRDGLPTPPCGITLRAAPLHRTISIEG